MNLYTENIFKSYKGKKVVQDVSIELKQGEIVGLLGPNGAGKTTSFYMIVGLVRPDSGKVFLNNVEITHLPMYKRAQMGLGYLPQEISVFRKLSVEDNIMAILEMTSKSAVERKHRLEELLDVVVKEVLPDVRVSRHPLHVVHIHAVEHQAVPLRFFIS